MILADFSNHIQSQTLHIINSSHTSYLLLVEPQFIQENILLKMNNAIYRSLPQPQNESIKILKSQNIKKKFFTK